MKNPNPKKISNKTDLKFDDIYALSLLQPLLQDHPFIPITGSSLRPFCLVHILNDILINGRKQIIEFGSGISTILMARLIRKNELMANILTIEHNREWCNVLNNMLEKERLNDIVKLVHAPLVNSSLSLDSNQWYDLGPIEKHVDQTKFDMVIVDGPPAWDPAKQTARYPAMPFIYQHLSENFSFYLDDANRRGEQNIIGLWGKKYKVKFNLTSDTLAYLYKGTSFFTEPFVYY